MRFRSAHLVAIFILGLVFCVQQSFGQNEPLTMSQITTGLQSTSGDFTQEERVKYLIDTVRVRGINFLYSTENENALRDAGAPPELLSAIKESSLQTTVSEKDSLRAIELYNLGLQASQRGEYDAAIKHYEEALAANPKLGDSYAGLAYAYYTRKEYAKAIEYYSLALIYKSSSTLYYNRAVAYIQVREYAKAVRDLNQVININAKHFDAYLSRGTAYFYSGEYENAIADFEKALDLKPENKTAQKRLENARFMLEKQNNP